MANKRPKPEEVVTKSRQVEVLTGQGMPRLDAIRQIGVTERLPAGAGRISDVVFQVLKYDVFGDGAIGG